MSTLMWTESNTMARIATNTKRATIFGGALLNNNSGLS